uniref:Uncharacterized protein n=1 Tax=Oryza punctata TaxID=4537 RepID=A0A0E0JW45_ORYPU
MAEGQGGVGGQPSSSSSAAEVVARRCGCGLGRLLYYSYTFSSRFVLPAAAARAPSSLAAGRSAPATATH